MNLLFGRKEFALNLERIIRNIDKNENVIAIHSEFGTGKSHFANEFKNYFEKDKSGHKFIIYNAWKNDYMEKPLGSIASLIKENSNGVIKNRIADSILEKSWKLGKSITPLVITALLRKYIGLSLDEMLKIKDDEIDKVVNSFISEEIKNHDEKKKLLSGIKEDLKKFKEKHVKNKNQKIVFIIDELDRCRPDFALELLETIKHIFDVEGYVFLLFLNERHLNSMIGVNYGTDVITEGYLRKFFDYEFKLPELNITEYIDEVIGNDFDLGLFEAENSNKKANFCYYMFLEIVKAMNSKISMRSFQHYDKKFRLILKVFGDEDLKFAYMLSFSFYFWFYEMPEGEKNQRLSKNWGYFIEYIPMNTKLHYKKYEDGITYSQNEMRTYNEMYGLVTKSKGIFALEFLNGNNYLNNVKIDKSDICEFNEIENWCKEKINFLKFIE